MREHGMSIIAERIEDLRELTEIEYFTLDDGSFDISSFRKYRWRVHGQIELMFELNLISLDECFELKKKVREIARDYRKKIIKGTCTH